jgi:membrane protein
MLSCPAARGQAGKRPRAEESIVFERLVHFLTEGLWRIRRRRLPRGKSLLLRLLRIIVLAVRGFDEDKCQLRAAALTVYTLLAVVPVMAIAFAIAKGFGLDALLERFLFENLQGHEEVAQRVAQFARNLLSDAQSGWIAGVGVVLLFWSGIGLLGTIESSFNDIWGIRQGRSLGRKLVQYPAVLLIAPLLLIQSTSLHVFLRSGAGRLAESPPPSLAWLAPLARVLEATTDVLPLALVWTLLALLYRYMPNTRVRNRSAIVVAILAGTVYYAAQAAHIAFQVGVARYNAVYGSLAALPLYLIWLQVSWHIILFGAEVCFAADNEETYEFERDCRAASHRFKRLLALRIAEFVSKRFHQGEAALDADSISHELEIPARLARELLDELAQAGILLSFRRDGQPSESYQPAESLDRITIKRVLDALDRRGAESVPVLRDATLESLSARLAAFDRLVAESAENVPLRDL